MELSSICRKTVLKQVRFTRIILSIIIIASIFVFAVYNYTPNPTTDSSLYTHNFHSDRISNYDLISNWSSVDSRPLPEWYDEVKFGIFIHWGVFSVPSVHDEWFWYAWKHHKNSEAISLMDNMYRKGFSYPEFAPQFTAEFFSPKQWAELFHASGAKYVVLTSKHHEGFTLWPSRYSWNWNAFDIGPHRDLVGELADAVRSVGDKSIKFGIYYSLYEWYNPLYMSDKKNEFKTNDYIHYKMLPELIDVVNVYRPEIVWADGSWDTDHEYWRSINFLNWLYKESPVKDTVVTNDRWGSDAECKHGGFLTCSDRYHPGNKLLSRKWENCMTIDRKSWGYRRNAKLSDYMSTWELVKTLVDTVSFGGNLLMNVGPTHDGIISPIYEERLREMGVWLTINGEAIYSTSPWKIPSEGSESNIWYTLKKGTSPPVVYCIFLKWPNTGELYINGIQPRLVDPKAVHLLGHGPVVGDSLKLMQNKIMVDLHKIYLKPEISKQPGWSLKFTLKQ